MNKLPLHITIIVMLISCSSFDLFGQRDQRQQRGVSPEQAFHEFEQKIIALRDYQITFTVSTEGRVESKIEGTITVRGGERIDLTADGTYGGQRVNVRMNSDGTRITGGTRAETFEIPAPEEFYKYFVQGYTRLGLSDLIVRLIASEPPLFPETEEEEQDWTEITYISTGERRFVGNVEAFPFGMRYSLFGESLGEGRLWINVASGLPFRREGSLRLEEGMVNVIEFYGFSR